MQKGFMMGWLILGVVVLITLGATYYYWQNKPSQIELNEDTTKMVQSPSPTPVPSDAPASPSADITNWKTYTNVKYHYSLKYPPNLSYSETSDKGNVDFYITGQNHDNSSADGFKQHLAIYFRGTSSPAEVSKQELNDKFHSFRDFQTDAIQGVIATSSIASNFSFDYYLSSKNGTGPTLRFFYSIASDPKKISDQEKKQMLNAAQGMLYTFKFTQ